MKKLEQTKNIMQRLFDPRIKSFNTYVSKEKKQIHKSMPQNVKINYYLYFLEEHWSEICGENLAKQCSPAELNGSTLKIKTSSSLFSNELFMMKRILLEKINKILDNSFVIKDLTFYTGKINLRKQKIVADVLEEQIYAIVNCPICGAKMRADNDICSVCAREKKQELQSQVTELLKIQPWLKYEECRKYIKCDRILFNDAKEILQNYYFEKVRRGYAEAIDNYMAVMLLTEKNIDELDERIINSSLEFLRRKKDVSPSGV